MKEVFITIFTPTYNRGYIIDKLYQSLKRQTFTNFEWIVVDDGSIDNTQQLFFDWKNEHNEFKIIYMKVKNGGKHRAINEGVNVAKGKLFFIVDSDDYLTDDALEKVVSWEKSLEQQCNHMFAGVAGAKGYSESKMIGSSTNFECIDIISQDRLKYGITGDKAEVFYTNVLKKFPFPAFEGENFITESVVWFAIGKAGYKIRWYNEIIYIADYLEDGLTVAGNDLFRKNPNGYLLALKSDLENLNLPMVKKMAYYAMYSEIAKKLEKPIKDIKKDLGISISTLVSAEILKKIKKILFK